MQLTGHKSRAIFDRYSTTAAAPDSANRTDGYDDLVKTNVTVGGSSVGSVAITVRVVAVTVYGARTNVSSANSSSGAHWLPVWLTSVPSSIPLALV